MWVGASAQEGYRHDHKEMSSEEEGMDNIAIEVDVKAV